MAPGELSENHIYDHFGRQVKKKVLKKSFVFFFPLTLDDSKPMSTSLMALWTHPWLPTEMSQRKLQSTVTTR